MGWIPRFDLLSQALNFISYSFLYIYIKKGKYSRMGGAGRTSLLRTLVGIPGSKPGPPAAAAAAAAAATAARLGAERDALLGTTLGAVASAVGAVGIDGIPEHDTEAIPARREKKKLV